MAIIKTRLFRLGLSNFLPLKDCIGEIDINNGLCPKFDESLTDESYYVPSADLAKTVDKLKANTIVKGYYDFIDGVVTFDAETISNLRKPGLDIAEVSSTVRQLEEASKSSLDNDVQKANFEAIKASQDAKIEASQNEAEFVSKVKSVINNES